MSKSMHEVWENLVSYQVTRDIEGWLECFAADAVVEWPFRLKGVPARLEGRSAIRAAVGPVWERAKEARRRITGHENVVVHRTTDPEVALVEFDMIGDTVRGPFRQPMPCLLHVRDDRVHLLREFVDTAALRELFEGA